MDKKDEQRVWIGPEPVVLRVSRLERIIALRHAELRAGRPRREAEFPADTDPATRHYAAFREADPETPIACVSCMPSVWQDECAYQLRGMAVRTDWTRRGLGRLLLRFAERDLRETMGVSLAWCNARLSAVAFYEKHGWEAASDVFEIPNVGPHRWMLRRLEQDAT